MDNQSSLNINMDGTPFTPGKPAQARSFTITMQGDPPPTISQEQVNAKRIERTIKQGQFAWTKLHGYCGCDPQWLDIWQYLIPARCDCKDGYQRILAEMPPDFTSPEAFFAWGVNLHNAVNRKLGKPEITIDEAYSIWRKSDGLEVKTDINKRP
jgi:hypothetical protein